jgi:DNA-binding response OmpR family regulator
MNNLVIEDDRRIASFHERGLKAEGHTVAVEQDGRDGLDRVRSDPFDLVILDRMLPYLDGMEVCRLLREEHRDVLVLMLSAKAALQDRIDGLKGGADDYLTKPFAFDELLAHIDALYRRRSGIDHQRSLRIDGLVLDPLARRVSKDDKPINLTVREFDLLHYLMINAGKVVSRQRLLNSVWDYGYDPGTKIVDVYVRYLRAKIDEAGAPSLIETVRGIGYMMAGSAAEG